MIAKNAEQEEKSGSKNRDFNRRWEGIDADFTGETRTQEADGRQDSYRKVTKGGQRVQPLMGEGGNSNRRDPGGDAG